jgi:hypothetical protein
VKWEKEQEEASRGDYLEASREQHRKVSGEENQDLYWREYEETSNQ